MIECKYADRNTINTVERAAENVLLDEIIKRKSFPFEKELCKQAVIEILKNNRFDSSDYSDIITALHEGQGKMLSTSPLHQWNKRRYCMKKTHILVTLAFDDKSPETVNIDTELSIQNDIIRVLQGYHRDKLISHYVVADNEVISEKLKSDDAAT